MESLNLTPAESLMIISPRSSGKEMIKLTLMDLLLKKALKLDIEDHESRSLNGHNIVISKGKSFELTFKPHEEVLMEILENNELKLKEFAKVMYKKFGSSEYKNMYVRDPLARKGYFERQRKMLLALAPYTIYILTAKGLEVQSKILELLEEAKNLDKWMREDLGRAKACLSVLGSHILLTNAYDISDIKKFNRILSYLKPESNTSDYYNYYLYIVPLDYLDDHGNLKSFDFLDISLLDYFDSFDDFFADFDVVSNDVEDHKNMEKSD